MIPSIRHCPGREKPWLVDLRPVGGGRRFYATEAQAKAAAKDAARDRSEVGREWADLPPRERLEVVRTLREMNASGVTLRALWEAWQARQIAVSTPGPTLEQAIREVIQSKREANLRPSYIDGLEGYLNAFARGRERLPIAAIRGEDVVAWFRARGERTATRGSNIGRLSSLFSFAVRAGWRTDNPVDRVERARVDPKAPVILTVRQAAKVLVFARRKLPRGLAWFALALMAGVRPEECDRLTWDALDLDRATLRIDAAASKVRRRRIVHLLPAAVAWLRIARNGGAELPLPRITRRRYLRAVRDRLGFEAWPQDVLRHSCASYLLALWQDAGKVADELGNSAAILLRHYRELVHREDAERFWRLIPRR